PAGRAPRPRGRRRASRSRRRSSARAYDHAPASCQIGAARADSRDVNTRRRSAPPLLAIACLAAVASGCGSTTMEHVTTPARLASLIRQSYRIADAQVRDGRFPAPKHLVKTLDDRLKRRHVVFVVGGAASAYGDRLAIDPCSGPDRLLI